MAGAVTWRRVLIARGLPAAFGALLVPAFAPFGLWPLAPVSLAGLLWCLRDATPRSALAVGLAYGLGCFGPGVYWVYISLHVFGNAPLALAIVLTVLLIAVLALFPAAAAGLVVRLAPGPDARRHMLAFPAVWALLEWVRTWIFSGFPWLAVGYSQIDSPLAGLAPVVGVLGLGMALAFTAGALVQVVTARGWARAAGPAAAAALWLASAGLGGVAWTQPAGEPIEAALIQGNISQDRKWDPDNLQPTIETYRSLTAAHPDAELVIWPEAAIPALYHQARNGVLQELRSAMDARGSDLLLGILYYDRQAGRYYNTVLSLGSESAFYYKHHLVPFGEFFPVPDFVRDMLRLLDLPYQDFAAGALEQAPLRVAGTRVGVSICYEDVFGAEFAHALPESRLLVNVSNDAWFGDSIAPHQHLEMARMRALETGRDLLRATNTGVTAIIDHRGEVRARLEQFRADALTGTARPRTGATPYVLWRDWPVVIGALVMLAAPLGTRRLRRRARTED